MPLTSCSKYARRLTIISDVAFDSKCECGEQFGNVDEFDKHLERTCVVMQDQGRGITDNEEKHMRILNLKRGSNELARKCLDQQLER